MVIAVASGKKSHGTTKANALPPLEVPLLPARRRSRTTGRLAANYWLATNYWMLTMPFLRAMEMAWVRVATPSLA